MATGEKIVRDLEHAEQILRDTVEATWDSKVKHSEPQVIVAAAMAANAALEVVGELESRVETLETQLEALSG